MEELSKFTIPLVIEKLEETKDKKGNPAKVTHVIVNSTFYHECISSSDIYKGFLIYVTIESINAKFNIKIDHSSYVILQNKHYQLPDNRKSFSKFIDSYIDSPAKGNHSKEELEELSGETLKDTSQMDLNANVRISLDLRNEIVVIGIKLSEDIHFNNLSLLLNEDRVVVKHTDQIINDFYISVSMVVAQASASFKSNILRIKCPVGL